MILALSIFYLIAVIARLCLAEVGRRRLRHLEKVSFDPDWREYPKVSVVIPARNEAQTLESALKSVLALDYPDFEVCVLNDRSTDSTGEILDKMREHDPRLRVLHIQELPQGWLGKNHAVHVGAQRAQGEIVLFTDADVVFEKDTLKRAVQLLEREKIDHIALLFRAWSRNFWMDCFVPYFGLNFLLYFKPWEARDPSKPKSHVGVGGFNLVRKRALEAVGYFSKIPLRPDDDVKLGKILKQQGFRQECLAGAQLISVEWYPDLGSCVRGLEKNMFSGTDYRIGLTLFGVFGGLLVGLLPFYVLFWGSAAERVLLSFAFVLELILSMRAGFAMGSPPSRSLFFPFAALLWSFIALRTMAKNLYQGGIYWRDTFYPLDELKRNVV